MMNYKKNWTSYIVITLVFLFHISLNGQAGQYNYACLNSTTILAEYLDENMVLETVNEEIGWKGSSTENDWYKFQFKKKIHINSIELAFYNNTCLKTCRLEFELIFEDTIFDVSINKLLDTIHINYQSAFFILRRKDVYPRGPGHINEIKILSNTKPSNSKTGKPKINLRKKDRLRVKYSIDSLSTEESDQLNQIWKIRKKFYNKIIKTHLQPYEYEQAFFDQRIFYGNDEKWYCYKINRHLNKLSNTHLITLFDDCQCEVHEEFFNRKMRPTESMNNRKFKFLGHYISYSEDSTESILVDYLDGGNAWAGHAIPHICLMNKIQYLEKIDSLKNDKNVFTQVQVIKGLLYFNEPKKALEISKDIHQKEMESLRNDSISIYTQYPWRSLKIMNEYYPNETLPLLLQLYKEYRKLYPAEMKIGEFWDNAYNYSTKFGERVSSFQGCDESILNYIEMYIAQSPQLSENITIREFKKYIDIKI